MTEIALGCECGKVKGILENIDSKSDLRVVCYCLDCQQFAKTLHKTHKTLDAYGGSDIYQTHWKDIKITQGADQLRCLKVKPKGIIRWYTACCETPIGNTIGVKVPFIGVISSFMGNGTQREEILGPVRGYFYKKRATQSLPESIQKTSEIGLVVRVLGNLVKWKFTGKTHPNSFFNEQGKPVTKPKILDTNKESAE